MKPIKLIMSAFGSYGGVEEIDFQKINNGIFLITGDTGAGKTTIFDAITYALFDETSGGKREGSMMRSQYADDEIPTFVEYDFVYNNEEYKIKRNPNYERRSKRKNKEGEYTYTTEGAAVELTLPDGTVFIGKNKETNEKIKEILGVDVNQFTQISMIAQGQFLKLLHAPSKERKEIFSRIFDTKVYWQIQNRLKEQSKELKGKLDDNLKLLIYELAAVWCPTEELKQQWEQAAGKVETGKEEICLQLSEIERYLQHQQERIEGLEQEHTEKLDKVKLQIARAEEIERQFQQKQEIEDSIQTIRKKLQTLQEKLREGQQYKVQVETVVAEQGPKLEQELAEARNLLPKYEVLKQRQQETEQLEKAKKQAEQQFAAATKQEEQRKAEQETYQKSQKELQLQVEQLPQVQQQEKECQQRKADLQELCELEKALQKLQREQDKIRVQLQAALEEFEQQSREYERKNRIFIEEQAGILAKDLSEGIACPVCGATHHPKKAELSKEAVTQQQVEAAKAGRELAQKKLDKVQESFNKQKEQYEGQRQVFYKSGQRLLGSEFESRCLPKDDKKAESSQAVFEGSSEAVSAWLSDITKVCSNKLIELTTQRKELERKQSQYQKQSRQLEQIETELVDLQQKKNELQQKSYEESLAYEKALQSLKELQEALTYPSKEALEAQIQKILQKKLKLEEKQKEIADVLVRLQQQIAKSEGSFEEQEKQLKLLKDTLKDKELVDIFAFRQQEQQLLKEKADMQKQKVMLLSGKEKNSGIRQSLERLYNEREGVSEKYQIAETLSKTANGNLRQQARLDLETYVQRRYFKYIIGEANRRLLEMSGGRFILRCREIEQLGKQGEAGLDLDVYDMVTNKVRDIKTLSGGESFLAALAMALGMADVIQKNAGRVHMDTMFIDEGFGSLDEEARRKAIRILQKLAGENRLIGIISHVQGMKEQMDRKLIITKGEKGSHAGWQIEG